VVLGDVAKRRRGRPKRGLRLRIEVAVLGVPFRAGAAHIVQVGAIGAAGFARGHPDIAKSHSEPAQHNTLPFFLAHEVRPIGGSTPFLAFRLWVSRPRGKVQFFKRSFDINCAPENIKICCDFGEA
jgi:hypothetical protein